MTGYHDVDPSTIGGLQPVEEPRWLSDDPIGERMHRHGVRLPLVCGAGVCLVRSCGWTCWEPDRGLAAWRHTRMTGHPTAYRAEPWAGSDLVTADSVGVA